MRGGMRKENLTKWTTSDVRSARIESAARRILHVPAKVTKETGIPARVADENNIGGHATCVCVAAQRRRNTMAENDRNINESQNAAGSSQGGSRSGTGSGSSAASTGGFGSSSGGS